MAVAGGWRRRKSHLALAQMARGGHGDAALPVAVHGAIEVIDGPPVIDHATLMGKLVVVGLRRHYEVGPVPVGPVRKVVAGGKGVVGIIGPQGIEGREVEHHIDLLRRARPLGQMWGQRHAHYLRVAGDGAVGVVGKDGIAAVALPPLHVFRQGNAYALALGVAGVFASGVVEHDEGEFPEGCWPPGFLLEPIYGALVLRELLPP